MVYSTGTTYHKDVVFKVITKQIRSRHHVWQLIHTKAPFHKGYALGRGPAHGGEIIYGGMDKARAPSLSKASFNFPVGGC